MEKNRRQFFKGLAFAYVSLYVSPYILGVNQNLYGNTLRDNNLPINFSKLGPLQEADKNGICLPNGFEANIIARSGKSFDSGYSWHGSPDGGATFSQEDGGWIYLSNSELPNNKGGVGAIRFNKSGEIIDAYSVLEGSNRNCSGGKTPWGTWLSGEEHSRGVIWEVSPNKEDDNFPIKREALGIFQHEAVAVDPKTNYIYMTNDEEGGLFYRFRPSGKPNSEEFYLKGVLEVAKLTLNKDISWIKVPDPLAREIPITEQLPYATRFNRGEGMAYFNGTIFFATTGDHKVWAYDIKLNKLRVYYDGNIPERTSNTKSWFRNWKDKSQIKPLRDPDDLTVDHFGHPIVAEDSDNMELCIIDSTGKAKPILRINGHWFSEVTGPAFSPDGTRLYFSSQRGKTGSRTSGGLTFEIKRKKEFTL